MNKPSEVFDAIYRDKRWGKQGGGSGRGSSKRNAATTSATLTRVLDEYDVHSLLDAPCGALEWTEPYIRQRRLLDPSFEYCGLDVVGSVVQANNERLIEPWCQCLQVDLATDDLPTGYDLILCRDALQHNSYDQIAAILNGFKNSGAKFLLVTSFARWAKLSFVLNQQNADIKTGDFFHNNLRRPPFGFRTGLLEVFDDRRPTSKTNGHQLLMYDLQALASSPEFAQFLADYGRG